MSHRCRSESSCGFTTSSLRVRPPPEMRFSQQQVLGRDERVARHEGKDGTKLAQRGNILQEFSHDFDIIYVQYSIFHYSRSYIYISVLPAFGRGCLDIARHDMVF